MPNSTVPDQLFQHARRLAAPFLSHEGLACATVPLAAFASDGQPIRSQLFREWLARTFYTEHEIFPSPHALRAAIALLEALAANPETPRRSIDLRVSSTGSPLRPDAVVLDLANRAGETVQITASGWTVDTPPIPFRRSRNAQPLPNPEPDSPGDSPAPFSLPGFEALHPACLAWLLAALRPSGPYPILILQGPHASGKTLLARMLHSLVDPASSSVCRAPRNQRDLLRLAWNNFVLVFDHATALSTDIADSLCRLSSGAGFSFDDKPDGSDTLIRFARPVILTTPRCESAQVRNRAILVQLPPIQAAARRGETELFEEFIAAHPRLLGRLCDAVSAAMSGSPATAGNALPAFVDSAAWAIAAAPSLGVSAERMQAALTSDAFARDLAAFVNETGTWEGSATALHAVLHARAAADLPASPALLSNKIRTASFAAYGIEITHSRTHSGGRKIRVSIPTRRGVTLRQSA